MILLTLPIARNFWHLRDCAWPSRAAYASPRLIADVGRRSVVRGSNAVVDREEKKISVLSQELFSAGKPFLYIYFPWFPIHPSLEDLFLCLFVEAISLSPRRPPGVTHPALTHSVTLSSQARSSSQFHSIGKVSRKEGPLSNPRTNCSVDESIISCAHWKPTPSTRWSARPPSTPRNKQTFLKILALCREKHRLGRKQRAAVRRLDHEESRHDRAGKKRMHRAVADRFDTDDRRRHLHACMHAYRRAIFFLQGCWNRYKPVLPNSIAIGTENGSQHWHILDALTVALSLWTNREEEKDDPCGPRKKKSRLFSKTLSSSAVLFPDVFFTGLCGFRFAEERRTFADMWTSLDNFSWKADCGQKCLWQQFWAFFYTSLWRARTVGPVLPALLFPVAFLDFLCSDRQISSRKRRSSLLGLTTLFRFRLYKRKIGLLIQNDPRRKSKKWPKDVV